MNPLLSWLSAAPQGAIAVVTAILAALVAVFVTILTQWILGRRARTDLLTKKLEELYLALNQASAQNVERFTAAMKFVGAHPAAYGEDRSAEIPHYALDLQKKIIMYVRLYFPQLSAAHHSVFIKNREINELIDDVENGHFVFPERLKEVSFQYGDALKIMEGEIIENRALLVNDHVLPRRFRRRT